MTKAPQQPLAIFLFYTLKYLWIKNSKLATSSASSGLDNNNQIQWSINSRSLRKCSTSMALQTSARSIHYSVRVTGVVWHAFTPLFKAFQTWSILFMSGLLGSLYMIEKSEECSSNQEVDNRGLWEEQLSCCYTPFPCEWQEYINRWRWSPRNSTYRIELREIGKNTKDP